MYSSSVRGRSPTSNCASSSTRAGVITRGSSMTRASRYLCDLDSSCLAKRLFQRPLEGRVAGRLQRRVHSLLGKRPMISQIQEGGEQVRAQRDLCLLYTSDA